LTNTAVRREAAWPEISPRELAVIRATAAAQARRLSRSLRLSREAREDAEQDILVMLLERWHYYDGARGSSIAFAIRIARQAVHVIAGRIVADRGVEAAGFDQAWNAGDHDGGHEALSVAETLADEAAPTETMIVDGIALREFLSLQPEDLALVACAIAGEDGDLAGAQRHSGLSSSEFYRRLRELRYRLVCLELAPRRWLERQRDGP
jgi:hypothetical protein